MPKPSRREEVMHKAARLFRRRGYAATSIRDIASEMEMKSPSLYNHIKSKEEILSVLLLSMAELYVDGIRKIADSEQNPLEKLEAIIADHIRITIEHTDAVSLIPAEWVHLDEGSKKTFLAFRDTYERVFRQTLVSCIKKGFLREVEIDIATFSILSTLRWLFSWFNKNPQVDPAILTAELTQNLVGGLKR